MLHLQSFSSLSSGKRIVHPLDNLNRPMGTLKSQSNEMLGLKRELQINYAGAVEADHDVSFIRHHTFFSTLKESFFLHKFECIEGSCASQSSQEYSTESSSSNTLDYVEVF